MTFRTRLVLAFMGVALLPLLIAGAVVRTQMLEGIAVQSEARAAAGARALDASLNLRIAESRARLTALVALLEEDSRFRLAAVAGRAEERAWLLDWAGEAAALSGLAMLQLLDDRGTILSSALFRNDFGRADPRLLDFLRATPQGAGVVEAPTPAGPVRVLATLDSLQVAGGRYFLTGGRSAEVAELSWSGLDAELHLGLVDGSASGTGAVVHETSIPFLGPAESGPGEVRYRITRDPAALRALERRLDTWFLGLAGAVILVAWLAGTLLARRVSRPVEALAASAERFTADNPVTGFDTDRTDELGDLARVLESMLGRLRTGAEQLRQAERQAVTGDLARQVNHDIKNGLVPIRNVLRHLSEVASRAPDQLPAVYQERQGTLDASVGYLDELARRYAHLAPAIGSGRSDVNAVVRGIVESASAPSVEVSLQLSDGLPPAAADEVALRRIVENLVLNAVEAMTPTGGMLTVSSSAVGVPPRVRLTIQDTGPGMTRAQLDQAFTDFHTTKPDGTGLGMTVVRRLVADLGGTFRVETEPGAGTTCIVEIPAA